MDANFSRKIEEIIGKDNRYKPDAYEFVMQALWFTQKKLKRSGHINAKELLEGVRKFSLQQYGPMAKSVFGFWGVKQTRDFGEIVFNMIDAGLLRKTEHDKIADFDNVYDFNTALDVFRIPAGKGSQRLKLLKDEKKNLLS